MSLESSSYYCCCMSHLCWRGDGAGHGHYHLRGTIHTLGPMSPPCLCPHLKIRPRVALCKTAWSPISQPATVPHLFLTLQGLASSVLRSPLEGGGKEGQRGEMHISQVPVKSLWGRKLKLMGKLWLSFIYATVTSISPEM